MLGAHEQLTVITGAGISAESGIPTFRGPEGYWTVGAEEYHPMEMATNRMFRQRPWAVWQWYLYRASVCAAARPNRGHEILVELEQQFQDRFLLITQNVDNLHLVAGNSPARTYQIHGNIFQMRCFKACRQQLYPLPVGLWPREKHALLTDKEKQMLTCPDCGGIARPHVLWFDECYDEAYFRFESALKRAMQTDLLLILGTSGTTNLPHHVANTVYRQGKTIIEIGIEDSHFTALASSSRNGRSIRTTCTEGLVQLLDKLLPGHVTA